MEATKQPKIPISEVHFHGFAIRTSFHYYNTLSFDPELIDYIDHVDDSIVLEKMKPL